MAIVIPYIKNVLWADGSGGGTPINAAKLNAIEEGILDVSQAPAVRAFHNAAQSATSGVTLALALNSERFDQAGGVASTQHDLVTNNSRLTCLYAGVYLITGSVEWAANATGIRQCWIRVNGATDIGEEIDGAISGVTLRQTVSSIYLMAVNDYVELAVSQNSGGALNVNSTGNYSPEFGMVRLA